MSHTSSATADSRSVFVVHGRNLAAKEAMFMFLRALGLRPIEWEQAVSATGKGAPFIGEVLNAGFNIPQAVVVILTGDDLGRLRPELQKQDDPPSEKNPTLQPRLNVVFETGMALAWFSERTILVEIGKTKSFSDIAGRHVLKFQGKPEDRNKLRMRLRTAGCDIDEHSGSWLTAGDFAKALQTRQPFPGLPSMVPLPISSTPPLSRLPGNQK